LKRSLVTIALLLGVAACSAPAPSSSAPPTASAPPAAATLAPPASSDTGAAAAPSGTATATGAATAEPAPTATATASAAASAVPEAPIPNVKVENIGMHVGGGPNDPPTKLPIRQSVEPHFDSLKRCYALVNEAKKGGDFGLDLLIDKAGGKAKVSHPRTSLKGAGFKECMVAAFEAIDFKKPRGGTTTVSYSVRFTP
jgi:hypothetical protein